MNVSESLLLKYLSDGRYHSGEELGELMGVTRTAVWKQVGKLNEQGISVESVKGKGYCIKGGLDLLDGETIRAQLSDKSSACLGKLRIELSVESTNKLAREVAEEGGATGSVLLAERQTAGRGRRGRQWQSPFGRNIYLSVVWGFDSGVEALEGLSLAVGVAVCCAAERCGASGLQLKWPNDLLFKARKVGGILLEVVGDPSGFCQVVIGVGLNTGMGADEIRNIDQPWGNLEAAAVAPIDRSVLAGCVLDELLMLLHCYERTGFAPFRSAWMDRDAFTDTPVRLLLGSREVEGVARGVSNSGALLLEEGLAGQGEVVRQYSGGEISLRSRQ
ncbi:MAG: bifunctional biotin--[acetyl-CoA-carboxylase] ligase/biotin operon repressor BirA [Porticoccaceae bacterium]|nr:bifunctional biotin--[acetyl-CoA-carboxylase] ligase/biotin operon repressor BirA [Pseudomonadales bacterium]MCP5172786.1 bifunctional biotin--[acetyl-CoA-carboxylase] ligase/biotin operon repressor BirA [Pseudomonadales bacterium]MCP5302260.1 bifunctional biotin--[acetyl-CoA-carboxylase] ligase/biotin operon repressor BirA [Pseudomonadales bacterium]